jgi:hypothetical protein
VWKTTKAAEASKKAEASLGAKPVWANKLTLDWWHHIPEAGERQQLLGVTSFGSQAEEVPLCTKMNCPFTYLTSQVRSLTADYNQIN